MGPVLHINSYFVTSRLHANLVAALASNCGPSHTVYVPVQSRHGEGRYADLAGTQADLVYSRCFSTWDRTLWPLKMLRIERDVARRFGSSAHALTHAHSLVVNGLPAYALYRRRGIPFVVTIRNTDVNTFLRRLPLFRRALRPVLEAARALIFLTPAYWRGAFARYFPHAWLDELEQKVRYIPNGVEAFWLANRPRTAQPPATPLRVLFVGRVVRNKNLRGVLYACELLSRDGIPCRLSIVGDGPDKTALSERDWSFTITDHGRLSSPRRLIEAYRDSDLLAVPSFRESFGLVYAEALSQGLPVVYSRDQGFDGQFVPGEVGYAVDPCDSQDIAANIARIRSDGVAIKNRALAAGARYSWEAAAEAHLAVYREASATGCISHH